MSSTTQRYPLSSPDGTPIPLEIMKPHSFIQKSFLSNVASSVVNVPTDVEIMSITVTEDCILKFNGTASLPVDGVSIADAVLVEKYTRICIAPKAATFTLIGMSARGIANIQFIEKWAGLAVQAQYQKR